VLSPGIPLGEVEGSCPGITQKIVDLYCF